MLPLDGENSLSSIGVKIMSDINNEASIPSKDVNSEVWQNIKEEKWRFASFLEGFSWVWNSSKLVISPLFWIVFLVSIISVLCILLLSFIPLISCFVTPIFSALSACIAVTYLQRKKIKDSITLGFLGLKKNFLSVFLWSLWILIIKCALYALGIMLLMGLFGSGIIHVCTEVLEIIKTAAAQTGVTFETQDQESLNLFIDAFVDSISERTDLLKDLLNYFIISVIGSLVIELVIYTCSFFSLPLVAVSGTHALSAIGKSFMSFNLNVLSVTGMALGYLIFWLLFNSLWLILGWLLPSFIPLTIFGVVLTSYVLSTVHILIQVFATKDVFWKNSFVVENQNKVETNVVNEVKE